MMRILFAAALATSLLFSSGPATAHKDHKKKEAAEAAANQAAQAPAVEDRADAAAAAHAAHGAAVPTAAEAEAEAELPFAARSLDWIGRLHPFVVHFPIALFPIAWLALLFARRRGEDVALIRALIVVAGASASAGALLGWPNTAGADAETVFNLHRWLGTGLGLTGLFMAAVAARSASAAASRAMVWALGLGTLAMLIQGWLGAALVHGVDHLAW